jgi:hypothetical protein
VTRPIRARHIDGGLVVVEVFKLVSIDCDDPQCGDSTWDHYCTARSEERWVEVNARPLWPNEAAELALELNP